MAGSLVAAVVSVIAPAPPASADSIGGVQAQIQALQSQVVAGATRIHQLAVVYQQDSQQAQATAEQVAADNARLAATQRQVQASLAVLRSEAVLSYTGEVGAIQVPVSTDATTTEVSREYLAMTVGNLSDTLDALRLQQRQVADAEAGLRADQASENRQLASAAAARDSAVAQASAEQSQLSGDQQRLSQLEAAAAAAAAAQRAAAQRAAAQQAAAQQAAAQQAAAQQVAPPPVPAPQPPAPQGLPVNGGLLSTVNPPAPPPPAASAPAPVAPPPATSAGGGAGGVWLQLRQCESGDNYQENTGNGFYGAYQFSQSTWSGLGYPGRPDLAPPAVQDQAAMRLQAEAGWGSWPACSAALGLT